MDSEKRADIRALLEEHVPSDLHGALAEWAAEQKTRKTEHKAAQDRHRLADALAAVDARLNGYAADLSDEDRTRLIAEAWTQDRKIGRTAAELLAETPAKIDWLIPGVLARGWAIKIAAREKVGKGTLIAYLIGALERGHGTVFGPATEPVTALILTEEPPDSVREKIAAFGIERAEVVYGWELAPLPWEEKVSWVSDRAAERGDGLVFLDNVSRSAAVDDEAGTELARKAEVLFDALRARGIACIIDHHHRKAQGRIEDKSRGTTALAGAVENNLDLEKPGSDPLTRNRRVTSLGRVAATRWVRTIALSEDGTDYELVADADAPQSVADRKRLEKFAEHPEGVTVAEFANAIEASEATARRVLDDYAERKFGRKKGTRPEVYLPTEKVPLPV